MATPRLYISLTHPQPAQGDIIGQREGMNIIAIVTIDTVKKRTRIECPNDSLRKILSRHFKSEQVSHHCEWKGDEQYRMEEYFSAHSTDALRANQEYFEIGHLLFYGMFELTDIEENG